MKLLLALLLTASTACAQQSMPGMQMPAAPSSNPASPPAAEPLAGAPLTGAPQNDVPLTGAPQNGLPLSGAPLSLDELLAIPRPPTPPPRAPEAWIAESPGRARQAGMLPNPVIGYEGDQIRGGSF